MEILELLRTVSERQRGFAQARRLYSDRLAPEFNPFDFIAPNEIKLSRILAWLLKPKENHGQGALFASSPRHREQACLAAWDT